MSILDGQELRSAFRGVGRLAQQGGVEPRRTEVARHGLARLGQGLGRDRVAVLDVDVVGVVGDLASQQAELASIRMGLASGVEHLEIMAEGDSPPRPGRSGGSSDCSRRA